MMKKVCLLMNLGFEARMGEILQKAGELGETVYLLTGDGLVPANGVRAPIPVNVMSLTSAELHVWSSLINEQLLSLVSNLNDVVIFAAGEKHCGILPIGTVIGEGYRIGA